MQQIYKLTAPCYEGIQAVRYIGLSKYADIRFDQHLNREWRNRRKKAWVRELDELGLRPGMEVIEEVEEVPDIASRREEYWICEFARMGAPLLNIYGVTKPYIGRRKPLVSQTYTCTLPTGVAFQQARINAGLTRAELAKEARMSRSTIEKMQNDEPVKVEFAVRACRTLNHYLEQPVTYQSLGIKTV